MNKQNKKKENDNNNKIEELHGNNLCFQLKIHELDRINGEQSVQMFVHSFKTIRMAKSEKNLFADINK